MKEFEKFIVSIEEDIEFFTKIAEAIQAVEREYIKFDNYNPSICKYLKEISSNKKARTNKFITHVERVFAYELYHQLRNRFPNEYQNFNLMINAEIPKLMADTKKCFPDIVIHSNQRNDDHQLAVCEIKRAEVKNGIESDLKKLVKYIRDIKFKYAFFIYVNGTEEELVRAIRKYNDNTFTDNIFCILIDKDMNYKIDSLKNIKASNNA